MSDIAIQTLTEATFDHATRMFAFAGVDGDGRHHRTSIPVESPSAFVAMIATAVLATSGGMARGLPVSSVMVSGHQTPIGGYELSFSVDLGSGVLVHFLLDVATQSPERFAAIKAHFQRAVAEAQKPDDPTAH